MEPKWLQAARKYLGQKEVPGPQSNPWILGLWATIPWIWSTVTRKDDTLLAWCGAFMRLVFAEAGQTPPKNWWRAREWMAFGINVGYPALGAVGVVKNGSQWHVGIIAGKDYAGNIVLLAGNQGNAVSLASFPFSVFQAYRWPKDSDDKIPMAGTLPVLSAALSTSEA